jgi:hypothetical protein
MDALKAKFVLQRICDRERIHGGGAVRASTALPFTRTRSVADDRAEGATVEGDPAKGTRNLLLYLRLVNLDFP